MKPVTTKNEQDDETHNPYNKTSKSIILKPHSLHENKYKSEDNHSNEDFLINSVEEIKSKTIKDPSIGVNNELYLSNMSSSIPWLNQNLAKLTEVNNFKIQN